MLELVDNTMLTLEVNEKEQAPLGQRILAMDICFYKRGELKKENKEKRRILTFENSRIVFKPHAKLIIKNLATFVELEINNLSHRITTPFISRWWQEEDKKM